MADRPHKFALGCRRVPDYGYQTQGEGAGVYLRAISRDDYDLLYGFDHFYEEYPKEIDREDLVPTVSEVSVVREVIQIRERFRLAVVSAVLGYVLESGIGSNYIIEKELEDVLLGLSDSESDMRPFLDKLDHQFLIENEISEAEFFRIVVNIERILKSAELKQVVSDLQRKVRLFSDNIAGVDDILVRGTRRLVYKSFLNDLVQIGLLEELQVDEPYLMKAPVKNLEELKKVLLVLQSLAGEEVDDKEGVSVSCISEEVRYACKPVLDRDEFLLGLRHFLSEEGFTAIRLIMMPVSQLHSLVFGGHNFVSIGRVLGVENVNLLSGVRKIISMIYGVEIHEEIETMVEDLKDYYYLNGIESFNDFVDCDLRSEFIFINSIYDLKYLFSDTKHLKEDNDLLKIIWERVKPKSNYCISIETDYQEIEVNERHLLDDYTRGRLLKLCLENGLNRFSFLGKTPTEQKNLRLGKISYRQLCKMLKLDIKGDVKVNFNIIFESIFGITREDVVREIAVYMLENEGMYSAEVGLPGLDECLTPIFIKRIAGIYGAHSVARVRQYIIERGR